MLSEVRGASEVTAVTFVYDHTVLTEVLCTRLRRGLELKLLVDREADEEGTAPRQQARLRELQEAGAVIHTGRGDGRFGRVHGKVVVLDKKVAFTGSPNLTNKSEKNLELCFRMVGAPVADILRVVAEAWSRSRVWAPQ